MSCCDVVAARAPLDVMIDNLKVAFSAEEKPSSDAIKEIMAEYIAGGHKDWREFALFCPHKYARNLVEFNDNFELIILCWLPGQESPIHNHSVRKRPRKPSGWRWSCCAVLPSALSFSAAPAQFLSASLDPSLVCFTTPMC